MDLFLSILDFLFGIFDVRHYHLNVHLDIKINSLLLIDISFPDLNSKSLISDNFLFFNEGVVTSIKIFEVVNHLSENIDFILDNFFVLFYQRRMFNLESLKISI